MAQGRYTREDDTAGCTEGAGSGARPKRFGRRFLPGSVAVVAAFTMPELSVGAGDLAGNVRFDDLPEPAAKPGSGPGLVMPRQGESKQGQDGGKPGLAGVRYAAILDLDLGPAMSDAVPPPVAETLSGTREAPGTVLAASRPEIEAEAPAFVPPSSPIIMMPLAGEGKGATSAAASLPVEQVAAVAAVPVPAPVAAPAPAAVIAVPPPPAMQARRAATARGMIEQVTPARIAAAQAAPAAAAPPAPSAPTTKPLAAAAAPVAPVAAMAAVTAPGTRAPVSAPAPAAKPAAAPVPQPARPAAAAPASAPVPAQAAAAIAIPRPANPALTAPAASLPTIPEITSRLITRVDGKAAGAVDFQQSLTGLKVRLGSIVEVLADRYDAAQLARIRASGDADAWLSLAELQAQGVPISYDPVYDEFNVGRIDTRPKAARKVHMDQISAPERGQGATVMDQVRR